MLRRELTLCLLLLAACEPFVPGTQPRPTASRADELRPDSPNTTEPQPNFAPGDVVEDWAVPDASVTVHFTRAGTHRVPAADSNDSGIPDFVEAVGATYRDVLGTYEGWGFRRPPDDALIPGDNGGDARFDVYLVDFALRADGAFRRECLSSDPVHCSGYMVQENDFAGYPYASPLEGVVTVSSHEYFHAVQTGYDALQGSNVGEGTAVWATERYQPALDDLEGFAAAYLGAPERSLDQEPSGPFDTYSYGTGLFFECLTRLRGADAVRDLWARLDGGASWLGTLEKNVAEDGGSIASILEACADANLYTASRARAGFGHARANVLGGAPVSVSPGMVNVTRSRMFRASSRYWQATALPSDAVAWWAPVADAVDGGADSIRVRFAPDVSGMPSFTRVPVDTVTPLGGATSAYVLVTNIATGGASVSVQLCVGAPAFVNGCRAGPADAGVDAGTMMPVEDAGVPDAGVEPPPPPTGCGCNAGGAPLLLLLAAVALRRSRRR